MPYLLARSFNASQSLRLVGNLDSSSNLIVISSCKYFASFRFGGDESNTVAVDTSFALDVDFAIEKFSLNVISDDLQRYILIILHINHFKTCTVHGLNYRISRKSDWNIIFALKFPQIVSL